MIDEKIEFLREEAKTDKEILETLSNLADSKGFKKTQIDENEEFEKKRFTFLKIISIVAIVLTFLSFNYAKILFGIAMGFSVVSIGLLFYERIDYWFLPGNSIKKMADSGTGVALFFLAVIVLFSFGLQFGENWLGDSSSAPRTEERLQSRIEARIDSDSSALSNTVDVPGNLRESDREQ